MQKLVPSRLNKGKFHLLWIIRDVRGQLKLRDKLFIKPM